MPQAVVPRQILLTTLSIALILAVAGVLSDTLTIFLLVFAGMVFGIFLNSLCRWLTSFTRLPYRWSYLVIVLLLLSFTVAGVYYLGWQIAEQANELSRQLRESTKEATERLRQYDWTQRYLPEPAKLQNRVTDGILPRVLQGMQSVVGVATGMLVILFVGLYAAFDPELYSSGFVKLIPPARRDRAHEVLEKLNAALARWIIRAPHLHGDHR